MISTTASTNMSTISNISSIPPSKSKNIKKTDPYYLKFKELYDSLKFPKENLNEISKVFHDFIIYHLLIIILS